MTERECAGCVWLETKYAFGKPYLICVLGDNHSIRVIPECDLYDNSIIKSDEDNSFGDDYVNKSYGDKISIGFSLMEEGEEER